MVSIPIGLRLNPFANFVALSIFSFNSSNKSLRKFMWQVAPMSSNQESLQEVNEFFEQTLLYANIAMRNKKLSRFKMYLYVPFIHAWIWYSPIESYKSLPHFHSCYNGHSKDQIFHHVEWRLAFMLFLYDPIIKIHQKKFQVQRI